MVIHNLKVAAPASTSEVAQQPEHEARAIRSGSHGGSARPGIAGFPEGRPPQVSTSRLSRDEPLRLGQPPSTVTPDHLASYELAPFKHPETGEIVQLVGRQKANGMFQPFKDGQPEGPPLTRVDVTGRGENSNLPSTIVADVSLKGGWPLGRSKGSSSGSSSNSYAATIGAARFKSNSNGRDMQRVTEFVGSLPINGVLSNAGSIRVRFGRPLGGQPGEWDPGSRTVTLENRHPGAVPQGASRVAGTAVFEITNASAQHRRDALDDDARRGEFETQAVETPGYTAAQLYGRAVEYLEFQNAMEHHDMMVSAGYGNTAADLFSGETGQFEDFYSRQVRTGHARSYEEHFSILRPGPVIIGPEQQAYLDARARRGNDGPGNSGGGSAQDYYNSFNK